MKNQRRKNYKNNNCKNKNYNPLRTQFDSNGPLGKVRGTAQQIADKYVISSREARVSGDRVLSEELLQYSEHYLRMIVQWRIDNPAPEKEENQDNDQSKESEKSVEESADVEQGGETETTSTDESSEAEEKEAV